MPKGFIRRVHVEYRATIIYVVDKNKRRLLFHDIRLLGVVESSLERLPCGFVVWSLLMWSRLVARIYEEGRGDPARLPSREPGFLDSLIPGNLF